MSREPSEFSSFIYFSERKLREREKQRAMIQEKLQERKQRKEREIEQQQVEQSQMVEEQEKAIKQVLNTQAGLAEEYVQTKKMCFFQEKLSAGRELKINEWME